MESRRVFFVAQVSSTMFNKKDYTLDSMDTEHDSLKTKQLRLQIRRL